MLVELPNKGFAGFGAFESAPPAAGVEPKILGVWPVVAVEVVLDPRGLEPEPREPKIFPDC